MGDLAPAPMQRTSEDVGRASEQTLVPRRKVPRKARPLGISPGAAPEPKPETELDKDSEPESGHQLDLLA